MFVVTRVSTQGLLRVRIQVMIRGTKQVVLSLPCFFSNPSSVQNVMLDNSLVLSLITQFPSFFVEAWSTVNLFEVHLILSDVLTSKDETQRKIKHCSSDTM